MKVSCVMLGVLAMVASGCSSAGSEAEPASTQTPTAAVSPSVSPPATIAAGSCAGDIAAIQSALDAYHEANGTWPTANGGPGDIEWSKLVPDFLSEVPYTDSSCDWQVNRAPEGTVCLWDKANAVCACGSVCTKPPINPVPMPSPTPAATAPSASPVVSPPSSPTIPISSMQTTGAITWLSDWDETRRVAEASGKLIIISFYTDVCPNCKSMYATTFSDEELGQFLSENFVPVKINTVTDTLDSEYGIKWVPTTVFTDAEGNEITDTRVVGAKSVEALRESAEAVLAAWSQ